MMSRRRGIAPRGSRTREDDVRRDGHAEWRSAPGGSASDVRALRAPFPMLQSLRVAARHASSNKSGDRRVSPTVRYSQEKHAENAPPSSCPGRIERLLLLARGRGETRFQYSFEGDAGPCPTGSTIGS
jgi:hypothetical protein